MELENDQTTQDLNNFINIICVCWGYNEDDHKAMMHKDKVKQR